MTSEGSKSGVHWIRLNVPLIDDANERATNVLPVPGRSLSSKCPLDSGLTMTRRITSSRATTAPEMALVSASAFRIKGVAASRRSSSRDRFEYESATCPLVLRPNASGEPMDRVSKYFTPRERSWLSIESQL